MHDVRYDLSVYDSFAVEGSGASGVKGITPDAGHDDTDSDWQPL